MPKTLGSRCLNGLLVDPHGELATAFGLYFHARSMEILEATTPDPAELWLPADCDFALVADIGPEALRHVMRALLDQDDGLPIVVAGLRTIDDAVVAVNNGAKRIYGEKIDFPDLEQYLDSLPSKGGIRGRSKHSPTDPRERPPEADAAELPQPVRPLDGEEEPFLKVRERYAAVREVLPPSKEVLPNVPPSLEPHVLPDIQGMSLANQERVLTSAVHALDEVYSSADCALVSSQGVLVFRQVAHAYSAWCGTGSGGLRVCESLDSCLEEIEKIAETRRAEGYLLAIGAWDTFSPGAREAVAAAYLRQIQAAPPGNPLRLLLGHCSPPGDWSVLRFTHQQLFRGTCLMALPELPPLGA